MSNHNIPVQSKTTLIKASFAAIIIAVVVLVSVILPAEYNIDPTGIGEALQLTSIAQAAEVSTVDEAALDKTPVAERNDTVSIEIPARKGLEYKLLMEKYAHLKYEWNTPPRAGCLPGQLGDRCIGLKACARLRRRVAVSGGPMDRM